MHGARDQLSQADQLMFRTSHPEPRYPATPTPKNRRRLRLPDHHPYLPDPDGHRLPQLIWPDLVTAGPWGRATTSGRAVLAMSLAKICSTRTWAEIATDLELPPSIVTDVGPVLHRIERQGHWPAVLTILDSLATRLQEEPAPIDYAARRRAGHDTATLRRALDLAAKTHPTGTPPDVVLRHFWELFTGGDIAYAPDPLRIPLSIDPYRHYRHHLRHPRPRPAPPADRAPRAQPTLRHRSVHRPPYLDTRRTHPALRRRERPTPHEPARPTRGSSGGAVLTKPPLSGIVVWGKAPTGPGSTRYPARHRLRPGGSGHTGPVTVSESGVLPCSGAAVRDWLQQHSPAELPAFEHEFNNALHTALTSFDLSAANRVVRKWWLLAAGRSQPATPEELELVDRARRGDLTGLGVLQPDGTFHRVA